ncbi:MAG: Uma2 family endonuclease [Pelatocladus maniniholoensis HA4357-MV3]|uniref:Uma2 family endonuclease n=1 Tax=Pelatocladus maniniholoensis HA4357-MV3 TaxID=1117104 RepID=A0A9E3H6V3_9NOST|nr:Uma2 family endonuclease [Pelatocladus maniniholoensis HA4357-MV3]
MFVYLPDQPTTFYDQREIQLPVPGFAKDLSLTVENLFSWLRD